MIKHGAGIFSLSFLCTQQQEQDCYVKGAWLTFVEQIDGKCKLTLNHIKANGNNKMRFFFNLSDWQSDFRWYYLVLSSLQKNNYSHTLLMVMKNYQKFSEGE